MKIRIGAYYPEADEADLLINREHLPESFAEEIAAGIYLYRERDGEEVVGLLIRGYEDFLRKVRDHQAIVANRAKDQSWIDEVVEYHHSLLTAVHDDDLIKALQRIAQVA